MRRFWSGVAVATACLLLSGADWPTQGGSPQRNGWAKSERLISKSNVSALKLLYRFRPDGESSGEGLLTAPIVNGNLITYLGFKEMLIFGTNSGKIFSIDADLNKPIWSSDLSSWNETSQRKPATQACPGGLTSPLAMAGSSSASIHFAAEASRMPAAGAPKRRHVSPYFPPLAQSVYPLTPDTLSQLAALYSVTEDGRLHVLNSSTGQDLLPPVQFVPPGAKVTSLSIWENVAYATTEGNCDGFQNALFGLDLLSREKKVVSFVQEGGTFSGTEGTAIGNDGIVYVHVLYDRNGEKTDHPREKIFALTPKDLKIKDYFSLEEKTGSKRGGQRPGITPLIFSYRGRDIILAGGGDGRLYLLDSKSLGGTDHATPLFTSESLASTAKNFDANGFRGAFASWINVDTNERWFYAPFSGPLSSAAHKTLGQEGASGGGLIELKLTAENGQPALQPVWISRDIESPAPAVVADGLVFVLSTGEPASVFNRKGIRYSASEVRQASKPATLYALDALTGKELYGSDNAISGTAFPPALGIANGRVYFTTRDNTVYCFGLAKGQTQLTEQ